MRPSSILCPLPLLIVLALSACTPGADQAPTAAPEEPKTAEAQPPVPADPLLAGTDASAVVQHASPDPAGFDRKTFAGSFAGILPCPDCPGVETSLEIHPDGSFALSETRQGGEAMRTAGTWTVDAEGRGLLLDPETKALEDRRFAIVSRDELRLLDSAGAPVSDDAGGSLRRN
jgi:copper homeostasis protein (lipoprotein)